jgi:Flagellar hook-associated protein
MGGLDQNGNAAIALFSLVAPTNPLANAWDGGGGLHRRRFRRSDPDRRPASPGTTADNSLCLEIAALRDTTSINGATYAEEYARIAANAGLLVSSNEQLLSSSGDLLDALNSKRDAVSGVSTDEEMVLLIQYQAGYEAASNYISVVKEMLDTLLRM